MNIKAFILRALLAANDQPMSDSTLKQAIRNGHSHVAFTESDLTRQIRSMEESKTISGTDDEVFGIMWALTPKGKIKAQQL